MHLQALILFVVPYFITVIIIYRQLRKIKPYNPGLHQKLFVSIVVACHNEEERIKPLLISLSEQDYPADLFEVIIVDDNSTDNTVETVRACSLIKNTQIIGNSGTGKKQAILTGIQKSSGELILTTDADCQAGRSWISTIASFHRANEPAMIICPVSLKPLKGFPGHFQELEFLSLQGVTAGTAEAGHPVICNGANLAFTRDEYFKNAGNLRFDIPTGDDVFLLHSFKKNGASIRWIESCDALMLTESAPDVKSFFRQRKRWASKGTAYRDRDSIYLGIVTFVTILFQVIVFAASFFDSRYITLFLLGFIIKSVPDFLVLHNTTSRYGRRELLNWFLPSQLIYPFYVLFVAASLLLPSRSKNLK